MYHSRNTISMKALTITSLFIASVLLIGVGGTTSPAYANHPVLVEGNYFDEGSLSFLKIFSEFAWWGAEESGDDVWWR